MSPLLALCTFIRHIFIRTKTRIYNNANIIIYHFITDNSTPCTDIRYMFFSTDEMPLSHSDGWQLLLAGGRAHCDAGC